MTDQPEPGHNNRPPADPGKKEIFSHFPAEERDRIRQVWTLGERSAPERPVVTEHEIEEALNVTHHRLGFPGSRNRWIWIASAAAVVLLLLTAAITLFVPATVTAPYGERASVTLPDGSTAELNSGSKLHYYRFFAFSGRSVRLDGEAFFSVIRGQHPFVVHANGFTVRVTGTKFNVRSWSTDPGAETEVAVSEGAVQFYPSGLPENLVTVGRGSLSRLSADMDRATPPQPVALDRIVGWRSEKLIFNDKSLPVIFRELERRFDTTIRLETDGMENETLTTYYAEPGDVETVINDICRVKGLRYAETANGFRIYK